MKKLTPQQIHEIGSRIVGPVPSLWIPISYVRTMEKKEPKFIVVQTDSELAGKHRSAGEFWDELDKSPLEPTVLALVATNILIERFPRRIGLDSWHNRRPGRFRDDSCEGGDGSEWGCRRRWSDNHQAGRERPYLWRMLE